MSHELVHVATDAARGGTEPWLVEGFADYVALRDTDLPDGTTLGRAIAAARRDGVPDDLPGAADFDTRAADLQARYEEAWLACRIIAERLGERGLVSVYDAAGSGTPVTSALAAPWTAAGRARRALAGTPRAARGLAHGSGAGARESTEGDRRPVAFSLERVMRVVRLADPTPPSDYCGLPPTPAERPQLASVCQLQGQVSASVKIATSWPPSTATMEMMTAAMRATSRPYSTAVAPFSLREPVRSATRLHEQ